MTCPKKEQTLWTSVLVVRDRILTRVCGSTVYNMGYYNMHFIYNRQENIAAHTLACSVWGGGVTYIRGGHQNKQKLALKENLEGEGYMRAIPAAYCLCSR